MKFGVAAASATTDTPGTGTTGGGTTGGSTGTGSASVSATMSSSAYTVNTGQSVTFTASFMGNSGMPTGSAKFQAGGNTISGCTATPVASGKATCTTNSLPAGASAISAVYSGDATYATGVAGPITQTVNGGTGTTATPSSLANLSTRGQVLSGNDVMIGGFVIGGSTPKTVVVRAIGPSLVNFGINNALADPTLQLVRSSDQSVIATNDNWGSASNAAQIQASGFAPSNSLESAILMTLAPGAYTAIVTGVGGGTGVGLIEVYEVDHPEVPLINISTRGQVRTGNDVMIGGFVVQGSGPQTVVVRARGPSLIPYGVLNTLANPTLQLVRSSDQATIATNDDWGSASNAAQISASGFAPSNAQESAILVTLNPGAYTAIVTGAGGGTGVGIIEVFAQ